MLKPGEICDEVIEIYTKKAEYPLIKSIILGIMAGMFIAIGGFAASLASHSISNVGVAKFVAGAIFPVGLILIVICGADLFTGSCLMVVPCAEKKVSIKRLFINWGIIYLSNFIGAFIFALLIHETKVLDANNYMFGGYVLKTAINKASLTFGQSLASGILCNILVSLAVWISFAGKDIASKAIAVWFPIMAFIVGGFEHCVANMYYFTIALLNKNNENYIKAYNLSPAKLEHLTFKGIIENIIPVTIGNIIGGGIIVGLGLWVAYKYSDKK
jgi:formate transporter